MTITYVEYYEKPSIEEKYIPNSKDFLSIVCGVGEYFVVGRTLAGGRHISPTVDWETALSIFKDYKDVMRYFGGGEVTMYERNIDDYDVVISEVIW